MKSAEETLTHISEVIAKIYERPEMYGQTPDAIDSVLFAYHHVWGFITERPFAVTDAISELAPSSTWTPKDVESTIQFWQAVDKLAGINSG